MPLARVAAAANHGRRRNTRVPWARMPDQRPEETSLDPLSAIGFVAVRVLVLILTNRSQREAERGPTRLRATRSGFWLQAFGVDARLR